MENTRIISRLDVKGENLIKTIRFEGLRKVGKPAEAATKYYNDGIDEIIFMDIVASLYQRNNLHDILSLVANNIFVPITAGGGVKSIKDAQTLLRAGADKIAINTEAVKNPKIITDLAENIGSQAVVLSIEAKKIGDQNWNAYTDNGREKTNRSVLEWVQEAEKLGAGEILLTSIDKEGTRSGFDIDLVRNVSQLVSVPVIACGGMKDYESLFEVVKIGLADAVAMSDCLHFNRLTIPNIKKEAKQSGIKVRI